MRSGTIKSVANTLQSGNRSDSHDVILLADGVEFHVHSKILSRKSNFFKSVLSSSQKKNTDMAIGLTKNERQPSKTPQPSGFWNFFVSFNQKMVQKPSDSLGNKNTVKKEDLIKKKSQQNIAKNTSLEARKAIGPKVIKIDQEPKVLNKILQFIYGEEKCASFESFEQAKATLIAAYQYYLHDYEIICGKYLARFCNSDTFVELYNLAVFSRNAPILAVVRKKRCSNRADDHEITPNSCCFTTHAHNEHFGELEFEALVDFMWNGFKYHPNEIICTLHQWALQNPDIDPTFCMEKFFPKIEWEKVTLNNIELINYHEYFTKKSMVIALLARSKILEAENQRLQEVEQENEQLEAENQRNFEMMQEVEQERDQLEAENQRNFELMQEVEQENKQLEAESQRYFELMQEVEQEREQLGAENQRYFKLMQDVKREKKQVERIIPMMYS